MKNNRITLFIIIAIVLISLSCSLLERSNPLGEDEDNSNNISQGEQSITSLGPGMLNTIVPTSELTITPESQNNNLEVVEIAGIQKFFFVTYDPSIWQVVDDGYGQYLNMVADPDCRISAFIPFGFDTEVEVQYYQEEIGSYIVNVEQYLVDNQIFLEIYRVKNEMISIAIDTGNDPENCLEAARRVVENSTENNFGPDQ